MNFDSLRELMEKIPVMIVTVAYLGWLGYGYYGFINDPGSPLQTKKREIQASQKDLQVVQKKLKDINDFAASLDVKKLELRNLAEELESTKAILTEELDVPDTMKNLLTEAKRAGIKVTGLKPLEYKKHDYYGEQLFELDSRGIYFQYVAFLDRVASLQRITVVDSFKFVPVGVATAKYVELESVIEFKTYRYIGTKADDLGKKVSGTSPKPAGSGT